MCLALAHPSSYSGLSVPQTYKTFLVSEPLCSQFLPHYLQLLLYDFVTSFHSSICLNGISQRFTLIIHLKDPPFPAVSVPLTHFDSLSHIQAWAGSGCYCSTEPVVHITSSHRLWHHIGSSNYPAWEYLHYGKIYKLSTPSPNFVRHWHHCSWLHEFSLYTRVFLVCLPQKSLSCMSTGTLDDYCVCSYPVCDSTWTQLALRHCFLDEWMG